MSISTSSKSLSNIELHCMSGKFRKHAKRPKCFQLKVTHKLLDNSFIIIWRHLELKITSSDVPKWVFLKRSSGVFGGGYGSSQRCPLITVPSVRFEISFLYTASWVQGQRSMSRIPVPTSSPYHHRSASPSGDRAPSPLPFPSKNQSSMSSLSVSQSSLLPSTRTKTNKRDEVLAMIISRISQRLILLVYTGNSQENRVRTVPKTHCVNRHSIWR